MRHNLKSQSLNDVKSCSSQGDHDGEEYLQTSFLKSTVYHGLMFTQFYTTPTHMYTFLFNAVSMQQFLLISCGLKCSNPLTKIMREESGVSHFIKTKTVNTVRLTTSAGVRGQSQDHFHHTNVCVSAPVSIHLMRSISPQFMNCCISDDLIVCKHQG